MPPFNASSHWHLPSECRRPGAQQFLQSPHHLPWADSRHGPDPVATGDFVNQVDRIRNSGAGDLVPWLVLVLACTAGIGMTLFWIGRLVS